MEYTVIPKDINADVHTRMRILYLECYYDGDAIYKGDNIRIRMKKSLCDILGSPEMIEYIETIRPVK